MSDLQCSAPLLPARHAGTTDETPTWSATGGSLTARGHRQVRAVTDRLAGRNVVPVWGSTYAGEVQTAEIADPHRGETVPVVSHGVRVGWAAASG